MTLQLPVSSAELTRAEQKILDFINTNPDTFLFSSIGQLAQQLELSDATLSRFARHVGCQDFKELKNLVLEQSASGPAVKLAGALQEGESFSLSAWMNRQQLYLQKTAEQLDPAEFERAVQALIQARQVYIHGKNASGSLAQLLFFPAPEARNRRFSAALQRLGAVGGTAPGASGRPCDSVQPLQAQPGGKGHSRLRQNSRLHHPVLCQPNLSSARGKRAD